MNTDLAALDARRAHAMLALGAGRPADADALLEVLGEAYDRHGHRSGALALRYNRLLAAVMGGDRRNVGTRLREVFEALRAAEPTDETVVAVTAGLERLCRVPVAGLDPDKCRAYAERLAAWVQPQTNATVLWPGEAPVPARVAELAAADAAAEALSWAAAGWGAAEVPAWIDALRSAFGPPAVVPEGLRLLLSEAAAQLAEPDLLKAYSQVVEAVEQGLDICPHAASEWALLLDGLEAAGLPDRIDYLPHLPRDRGHAVRAELHLRLARALESVIGAEALALGQWRAVEYHAQQWQVRVEGRRARGTSRAQEFGIEATLGVWRAEAARAQGGLSAARHALRPAAERARRRALDNATEAALVLVAQAELEERAGSATAAANTYADAFGRALPAGELTDDAGALIAAIDRVVNEDRDTRLVALGLLAYVGQARTAGELTVARADAARDALALARPILGADDVAQLRLAIEASAAAARHEGAALQAAEAALAMRVPGLEALALVWEARARYATTPDEAVDLRDRAMAAARRAAAGPLRHATELLLAEFAALEGDDDRVAVALRRAAEVYEGPHLGPGAESHGHLVQNAITDASGVLSRLVESQRHTGLARRLAAAVRRSSLAPTSAAACRAPERTTANERARARWLLSDPPLGPSAPALAGQAEEPIEGATDAMPLLEARWAAPQLGSDDIHLELTVFDDWTLACCADEDGMVLRRLPVGRATLADAVSRFRVLLVDGEADDLDALIETSKRLTDALLDPFAARLAMRRRLWIAADGPLTALPFGPVAFRGAFLGERFELVDVRPAAPPRFDLDRPPAPPRARLLGDAVTAEELRLTQLVDGGAVEIFDTRYGADVAAGLDEVCADVRLMHVTGALTEQGDLQLVDEAEPTSAEALAGAMARAGVVTAVVTGPVEGLAGRRLLRALLPALRGGVLVRAWDAPDDQTFLWTFYHHAAGATDAAGVASAVCAARRATVRAGRDPRGWAAYTLITGC